jgi:tetratricopeptide (TPR) repeat protein
MSADSTSDIVIFTEAVGLSPQTRRDYLDRVCAGKDDLRRKVEALLRAHDRVEGFLEEPPPGIAAECLHGIPAIEKAGDRIGRYKLLQQIGEGGCGVVFMAEQEEPVRRQVALKIIKPGMDTKSVIARFEAERQALALMDHPSIAKIFDAGATESGRPYFVMELVRGIKITEYCDQYSLTTEERLTLFIQVCHAVQHAHQKGIIHRDIKPSNILVTTNEEGARLPVVIDFGIAKVTTNQRLTDKTLFTAFEMLIGTPAYMSPEQAELSSAGMDTRTDIYSLGVLLYELLTGSTPFDTGALLKAGVDEIRRVIREQEPARPSTRLSRLTDADLTTVAQRRHSAPPALIRAICGDLDWIVMKALEKDRTRRYETANGLAMDLQRHLSNEPVVARPAGAIYRVQKFIRRNKLVFAAGTAIATILVLGIAASLAEARRAVAAEKVATKRLARALAAEQQATANAAAERMAREEAEAISKFMTEAFHSPNPARDGRTITVAETLDRAARSLEHDLTHQPELSARLEETLASTYDALGLARQAIPLWEKVRNYHQKTLGLEHTNTLADMGELATSYLAAGRRTEAIKLQEEVLRLRRKINGTQDADTLVAMGDLANSYFAASRQNEALKLREEVLAVSRKVKGESEDPVTMAAMNKLATSYTAERFNLWEELNLRVEMLALSRKVKRGPENPVSLIAWNIATFSNTSYGAVKLREELLRLGGKLDAGIEHPETLTAMSDQADSYFAAGRRDEAIKLREEVLRLSRKVNGPAHTDTLMAMTKLADSYSKVGRNDEAIKLHEEALELRKKAYGLEHPDTLTEMGDLASLYFVTGHIDQAIKLGEELLKLERKVLDPEHPDPVYRTAIYCLAASYAAANRHDEALKLREEGLTFEVKEGEKALSISLMQDSDPLATAARYAQLGFIYYALGRKEEAIKDWQEAVRTDPVGNHEAAYWLGEVLVDSQRYAEALPILRANQNFYPNGKHLRETAERLAFAEAKVAGRDPLSPLRQKVDANPSDTDEAKRLATVYLWLGQTNEHEAICRKLLDLAANSKDPTAHDRAAKAYLLQAHPDPELLKRAVASGRKALELAATNDSSRAWFLVTAGMAAVRDGRPAEAESLLNESLKVVDYDPNRRIMALAYRALARAHLGGMEEARIDFAELEDLRPALPVPPALSAILLDPDFLAVCLAHEEAKALLSPQPPPFKR